MNLIKHAWFNLFLIAACTFLTTNIVAQDTLRINLHTAEQLFLEHNLQLLAEKYQIDMAKANLIQAKVFENPSISAGIDVYNPDNNKWFDASQSSGQYSFGIEQVIRLGGKRNKEISLANINVKMSENQFYDLMRTLHFTLSSVFYEVYFTLRSLNAFNNQIELLEGLQVTYKELQSRGVVSLSEVVRISSLLYNLKSDQLELLGNFNELQAQLQLLLQNNQTFYIPVVEDSEFAFRSPKEFLLGELIQNARENRVDLNIEKNSLDFQKKNLALQKSAVVPDLVLGVDYDKRGSFTDNLVSARVGISLPLFNRNQGNIRLAKAAIKQGEILVEQKQTEIENEVLKSYNNAVDADKIYSSIDKSFETNLENILHNVTENFRKKNISMLEFTDFYESYRDNIIKINQIRNTKVQTMEMLKFVTGINNEN